MMVKRNTGRAVIIGGGIAGLATARVVAEHYQEVLVLDRDRLPETPAFRAGIPQALHAHTLLPYGQMVLEKLFPGLVSRLLAEGAPLIEEDRDTLTIERGEMRGSLGKLFRPTVSCSRPMLERALYQEIAGYAQVRILQGSEVTGLTVDESSSRVSGVMLRSRMDPGAGRQHLSASLVVDASGRNSKAPQWLAALGYPAPEEWRIDAQAGYASRIYRQPQGGLRPGWKKLNIVPSPPDEPRGGVILPLEGSRWHVTLFGFAGDVPPTDEAGFLEFARSLSSPELYEAIRAAEPLGRITGYRKNENRVRRFENLPRYLEGLLVLGDAAYTMNPVYALGMTAALVGSQVLDQVIQAARSTAGRTPAALSAVFQRRLAASLANLWKQAVQGDWRWPATDISDNTEELYYQAV